MLFETAHNVRLSAAVPSLSTRARAWLALLVLDARAIAVPAPARAALFDAPAPAPTNAIANQVDATKHNALLERLEQLLC